MTLKGLVSIVSGAASGIGRECALALAREGSAVVALDLDGVGADETAKRIRADGGQACAMPANVVEDADMAKAVELALASYGRLDIAANVAGGGDRRGPIDACTEDDFDVMISLNLKGTFLAMRHQLKAIKRNAGGGSIINISSTAGLRGIRESSLYSAAKHGVIGLTRCAALDYAAFGVRVNAICPGAIETPQFERVLAASFPTLERSEALAATSARFPLGRVGRPSDVAELVVWLASEKSAYLTGQAIAVDGGFTA